MILRLFMFRLIPFREVENIPANQMPGRSSWFLTIDPKDTNVVEGVKILRPVVEFCSVVSEKKSKTSHPMRGQGGHLFFSISPRNSKRG